MANLKPFIFGLLLTGLFAISLINIGIYLPLHNDASQSIGDDPTLSAYKTQIESELITISDDTNSSLSALGNSPLSLVTSVGGIFDAVGGIWKTLTVVPKAVYNLTIGQLVVRYLGDDSYQVVLGVLAALVTVLIIFGVIKLTAQGESG